MRYRRSNIQTGIRPVPAPSGRNMYYHDLETESHERRRKRKWRAIGTLLEKAWLFSSEFKTRMHEAGIKEKDVRDLESFSTIPPLRKRDIIRLQAEHGLDWMLTRELGELQRIYQSPGPIFDPEGVDTDYWGWAEAFYAAGFRPRDVVQMTFSYHLTPAGLMFEEPLRAIGCAVIPAGPGNTAAQIEIMTRLPVSGFVGMTSFLHTLGRRAQARGLDLRHDFSLRTAFVAAEKLTESMRREVEEMFGVTVRQGYGTADAGCIAYECEQACGMHLSSRALVEICDPATGRPLEPGETGEVVVTPFTGEYPLIRLATGDLSRLVDAPCPCGRTSPRLEGWLGRVDDTAKVKGQFIYPDQASQVMDQFEEIDCWQLVVDNPEGRDTLTCRIQLRPGAEGLDRSAFARAFQDQCKLRPAVEIITVPANSGNDSTLASPKKPDNQEPRLVDRRTFDS